MGIPLIKEYDIPSAVKAGRAPLSWTVNNRKAALLIHDMQNFFLDKYESKSFVQQLVLRIESIRKACHAVGIPTYYTAQQGDQTIADRGLLVDFWGPGMPALGNATEIVPGLEPVLGVDRVVIKHRYSAFSKNDFLANLKQANRTQLIICGVYAHIGCLVTAADAFMSDIEPFVIADALGDFSLEHHEFALNHIANCSGKVLSTAQLLEQLEGTKKA